MKIGYLNSGKTGGDISRSVSAILARGVDSTQVLNQVEHSDWNAFENFLSSVAPGDTVVIHSLFDFCVSIKDLFRISALSVSTGVRLQSACEDWFDTCRAETSQAGLLVKLEQFYFDTIARQTKQGLEKARRNGKIIGRRAGSRKITDEQLSKAYMEYYENGCSLHSSCRQYDISSSTLYRYIKYNSLPTRNNSIDIK